MPLAILTIGIPASGKTHWASLQPIVDISLDEFREQVCGDHTNQDATAEAVKLQDAYIERHIAERRSIIVANTNLNPEFRAELVERFLKARFEVKYQIFRTPFILCQGRNLNRPKPVPESAMERMKEQFEAQFGTLEPYV